LMHRMLYFPRHRFSPCSRNQPCIATAEYYPKTHDTLSKTCAARLIILILRHQRAESRKSSATLPAQ
jgi:hypothetical protein